ncbi:MAG: hypothetical protein R3C18_00095 [Planctomycetaceae bacterium]
MNTPIDLDSPLMYLDPLQRQVPLTIRQALEGTAILGGTGSGKTTGSGYHLAMALLSHPARFGGLITTAKLEDRAMWERFVRDAGREDDLIVFSMKPEDEPHSFNFLDDPAVHTGPGGQIFNLVSFLETIIKSLERGQKGGEAPFWKHSLRQVLRLGMLLLRAANGHISLQDLHQLVVSAPRDARQVADWQELEGRAANLSSSELETLQISKEWHTDSYCCDVIDRALRSVTTDDEQRDVEHAVQFWCKTWPILPNETRESVSMTFLSMADYLLTGSRCNLFTTDTTVSPADTFDGKLILIDMPVLAYQDVGILAATIWKYAFQLAVQARDIQGDSRPVFLWSDEAHLTLTEQDNRFQTVARGLRCATVLITQNLDCFYEVLSGNHPQTAKYAVDSLMGNLSTKIFHANSSATTNKWAAELIGKQFIWQSHSLGENGSYNMDYYEGRLSHSSGDNLSAQRVYKYQVEPIEFTQLQRGGPTKKVEAILFQNGRQFASTGSNYLRTVFPQPELPQATEEEYLEVQCPHCGEESTWNTTDANQIAECPTCQQEFTLPTVN